MLLVNYLCPMYHGVRDKQTVYSGIMLDYLSRKQWEIRLGIPESVVELKLMNKNMPNEKSDEKDLESVEDINGEGESWPQIVAILIGCFSSLTTGLLFSWPSPFMLKLSKDKDNYDISEEEASFFTIIPPIAMMLFSPLSTELCDIIGRKRTLLLSAIPYLLAWLLTAFARHVYVFYAARLLTGVGDGIVLPSLAMYMAEISTPRVRGTWGNTMTASFYLGELAITVIGNNFSVKETSYICSPVIVAFAVFFWFMPESPYFYIMKGQHQEAKNSLRIFRRTKINREFVELKAAIERQVAESGTWRDLFLIGSNRRALLAGVFLRTSQLLGGSSVFIVSTMYIFEKSGGNVSAEMSSVIYMTLWFFLNICASFTVDLMGRKISYIVSLLPCALVLLLESIYFYVDKQRPDLDIAHLNWFPLAGMIVYIVFSSFGIGIVPTLMLGELFSASIKAKGLCALTFVFGALLFISNYAFHFLNSKFGLFAPFLFFSVCNFVSAFLAYFLIPETKGKTLEEIQQSLKRGKSLRLKETKPFLE